MNKIQILFGIIRTHKDFEGMWTGVSNAKNILSTKLFLDEPVFSRGVELG